MCVLHLESSPPPHQDPLTVPDQAEALYHIRNPLTVPDEQPGRAGKR